VRAKNGNRLQKICNCCKKWPQFIAWYLRGVCAGCQRPWLQVRVKQGRCECLRRSILPYKNSSSKTFLILRNFNRLFARFFIRSPVIFLVSVRSAPITLFVRNSHITRKGHVLWTDGDLRVRRTHTLRRVFSRNALRIQSTKGSRAHREKEQLEICLIVGWVSAKWRQGPKRDLSSCSTSNYYYVKKLSAQRNICVGWDKILRDERKCLSRMITLRVLFQPKVGTLAHSWMFIHSSCDRERKN
jgi:hypothetical protein